MSPMNRRPGKDPARAVSGRGIRDGAIALAALAGLAAGTAGAELCPGDCDGSESVVVNEIVLCTTIALGTAPLAACDACDAGGSARVLIHDLVAAVAAALNGCPRSSIPSATARFAPAEPGTLAWGDIPFPSDVYRDGSGAIRIGALPTTKPETALHVAMRDLVETRDGFCATCNVYFRIDGDIDAAGLPLGNPPSTSDAVFLADIDPDSPERGRLFPLLSEWNAERQLLAVRPVRGIALHRSRRYAAVLTTALHAADGTPIAASAGFRRTRSGLSPDDTAIEHARSVLAPAFSELERLGVGRARIAALAAFTTEDVVADIVGARAAVQGGSPPEVSIDRRRRDAEIDELLGIPSEDRPGIDVPPADGVAGTRSIAHSSIADVITGTFIAPRIVSGAGTDIGTARRNAEGRIVAGPGEAVPFVLTLPKTPAGSPLPVVIAHHGFNASRVTGFASGDTAARAGVAVLAIDAFQHGERAASARDEVNAMRGDLPGADGFAETNPLDLSGRVFGLLGASPGLELFPGYPLGAFLQFLADVASAVRAVREGSLAEALREHGLTTLDELDPARIGFIGNSLGAVVGASVLVAEPFIGFAVQNVAPGSIVETLAQSPEFRPLVEALFLPVFGIEGPFDEVERHLLFDPIVDLSRWILEPVDPLALAPYLFGDPIRDDGPAHVLFQIAALDEVASSLATDSMLAASGAPRVTRYDPAAHGMLEVRDQVSRYEPPAAPPFVVRPTPLPVANPIVEEHDEIAAFLAEQVSAP